LNEEKSTTYPPAVERALRLLDYIAEYAAPLSIKELSEALHIPHVSTFRIVKCMENYGYLRLAHNQSNKFVLGYKLLQIAKKTENSPSIEKVAVPYMQKVAEATNQACQLCVLADGYVKTIEQVLPPNPTITFVTKLGAPVPANLSSSGKLLFSYLPQNQRNELLKKIVPSFRKNTEHTIVEYDDFVAELELTHKRGYAIDNEEFAIGLGCLAYPIYDFYGVPVAALNLVGLFPNYSEPDRLEFLQKNLLDATNAISQKLGYFNV